MLGSTGRLVFAAVLLLGLAGGPAAAAEEVDLELVLAVDVSGSMDRDEQILQRSGYIEAIRHPEVIAAIRSGLTGRIALAYLEWAGPGSQRVVVPWQLVDGQESADAFVAILSAAPLGTMRGTSISSGLIAASALFENSGFSGQRRVIDVSGDGPNNMGLPVSPIRDGVVARDITINGLPIMLKQGGYGFSSIRDLDDYYSNCVIGGPGAFLVPVDGKEGLVEAIRRKLVLEIADLSGGFEHLVALPVADPGYDCQIGERQRRMWLDR